MFVRILEVERKKNANVFVQLRDNSIWWGKNFQKIVTKVRDERRRDCGTKLNARDIWSDIDLMKLWHDDRLLLRPLKSKSICMVRVGIFFGEHNVLVVFSLMAYVRSNYHQTRCFLGCGEIPPSMEALTSRFFLMDLRPGSYFLLDGKKANLFSISSDTTLREIFRFFKHFSSNHLFSSVSRALFTYLPRVIKGCLGRVLPVVPSVGR